MNTFNETQKSMRIWLLALMLLVWAGFMVFTVYAINRQIVNGEPVGSKPLSDAMLIVFLVVFNVIFMFLETLVILLRLDISIDKYGISFSYFPFLSKRTIQKEEIQYAFVRKYKPVKEYGGWGYRSMLRSKAYNVFGKWGIQIVTKKGRYILLGTQKPEEARKVLEGLGYEAPPLKP